MQITRKPDVAHDQRAVLDAIRRIVQALRHSSQSIETRTGLSAAQLFVLQKVAESDGASVGGLTALTLTGQSSVSLVMKKLITKKLVVRARSVRDSRKALLTATARGRAMLRRAPEAPQLLLIRGLRRLPVPEQRRLARSLSAWLRAMKLDGGIPELFFEGGLRSGVRR